MDRVAFAGSSHVQMFLICWPSNQFEKNDADRPQAPLEKTLKITFAQHKKKVTKQFPLVQESRLNN